jgi:hypothetical protein
MIDMNSFGSNCPDNWQEIADYLNSIDNMDNEELWEAFCADKLKDCPKPIYKGELI